jgi:hypothetical protein
MDKLGHVAAGQSRVETGPEFGSVSKRHRSKSAAALI